jgi:hypothetical protein
VRGARGSGTSSTITPPPNSSIPATRTIGHRQPSDPGILAPGQTVVLTDLATGNSGVQGCARCLRQRLGPTCELRRWAMSGLEPGLDVLAAVITSSRTASSVARMARFGVRSGSLGRSVEGVISHNQAG